MIKTLMTIAVVALIVTTFAGQAQALEITGGTAEQRHHIEALVQACAYPPSETEARLGGVTIEIGDAGDDVSWAGYASPGYIFLRDDYVDTTWLDIMVPHEWAHQIWASLTATQRAWWPRLCGTVPGAAWDDGAVNPAENFAECTRVALWPDQTVPPMTSLKVVSPSLLKEWIGLETHVWRPWPATK